MKIIIDVIHGDKRRDEFMRACDFFESFKVLGEYEQMSVTGEDGIDLENLTTNLKNAYEKCGKVISFLSISQIDGKMTNDYERYIRPGTSSISDGKSWGMFCDILEKLGYEVNADNHMQVLDVKLAF